MLKFLVTIFAAFASLANTAHAQTANPASAQQSIEAMRSYLIGNIQESSRFSDPTVEVNDCVLTIEAKWQRRRSTVDRSWRLPIGRISKVSRQNSAGVQLVMQTSAHVIEYVAVQSDGVSNTVWKSVMFLPVQRQFDPKQFDSLVKNAQLACKG